MTPLPIDERRVAKLAEEADKADAMRGPGAKAARTLAYRRLAAACNLAADNARRARIPSPIAAQESAQ